VQDITHAICINSTELLSLISILSTGVSIGSYERHDILSKINEASFYANKIMQLSRLITKADIVALKNKVRVDVIEYVTEYLDNFRESLKFEVENKTLGPAWRMLSLLDIAIVLDNLISNSKKNGAHHVLVRFGLEDKKLLVDFCDDGYGVDLDLYTPETIFEEGVTNRRGGSGIGLHTIKFTMEEKLKGRIEFLGNGLYGIKGAAFRLIFD
jgi:Signal transduction histidine kinase